LKRAGIEGLEKTKKTFNRISEVDGGPHIEMYLSADGLEDSFFGVLNFTKGGSHEGGDYTGFARNRDWSRGLQCQLRADCGNRRFWTTGY
jgi:hypothetical protein